MAKNEGIELGKTHRLIHNQKEIANYKLKINLVKIDDVCIFTHGMQYALYLNKIEDDPMQIEETSDVVEEKKIYKRKTIPAAVRTRVWNNYFKDKGIGKCFINCGESITLSNFECGHVIAVTNGGTNKIDNLRPICSRCNKSMGTQNLIEFIEDYGFHN